MKPLSIFALALATSGCATLGGNVAGDFACDAPNGICAPASAIDARAIAQLPGAVNQPVGGVIQALPEQGRIVTAAFGPQSNPARSSDKTIRVVFPAHIDGTGLYHDEATVHAVVERGAWVEALAGRAEPAIQQTAAPPQRPASFWPGTPAAQASASAAVALPPPAPPASAPVSSALASSAQSAVPAQVPAGWALSAASLPVATADAPRPVVRHVGAPPSAEPPATTRDANIRSFAASQTPSPAPGLSTQPQTLKEAASGAGAPLVASLDAGAQRVAVPALVGTAAPAPAGYPSAAAIKAARERAGRASRPQAPSVAGAGQGAQR